MGSVENVYKAVQNHGFGIFLGEKIRHKMGIWRTNVLCLKKEKAALEKGLPGKQKGLFVRGRSRVGNAQNGVLKKENGMPS